MAEDKKAVRTTRLIAIPTLITLAITILRVVGELKHWPKPWFSTEPGGGGAIVGISWLPLIFGPYFALKLADAGEGATSTGKSIAFALGSLPVFMAGAGLLGTSLTHPNFFTGVGALLMLASAFVPGIGWRSLGKTLVAYAFAARVPVAIVYYFAILGNGGAGWGTHYDRIPPNIPPMPPMEKLVIFGLVPQLTLWIGFTVVVGSIVGTIVAAVMRRKKQPAPVPA